MIHRKFNQYVVDCSDNINNHPKKFWNLVGSKQGEKGYPDTMKLEAETATDDKGIAELFNTFFTSVFTKNSDEDVIPNIPENINLELTNLHVETHEVLSILKNLNPRKAVGPDGISSRLLKECADPLHPLLQN